MIFKKYFIISSNSFFTLKLFIGLSTKALGKGGGKGLLMPGSQMILSACNSFLCLHPFTNEKC